MSTKKDILLKEIYSLMAECDKKIEPWLEKHRIASSPCQTPEDILRIDDDDARAAAIISSPDLIFINYSIDHLYHNLEGQLSRRAVIIRVGRLIKEGNNDSIRKFLYNIYINEPDQTLKRDAFLEIVGCIDDNLRIANSVNLEIKYTDYNNLIKEKFIK